MALKGNQAGWPVCNAVCSDGLLGEKAGLHMWSLLMVGDKDVLSLQPGLLEPVLANRKAED